MGVSTCLFMAQLPLALFHRLSLIIEITLGTISDLLFLLEIHLI